MMMRVSRRLRFSLLSAMVMVAFAAALFGWAAAERRKRIVALAAEYQRQEKRLRWAEQMHEYQYIPKARLAAEQKAFEEVQSQLTRLGADPTKP
jgi:Tfp pilus assembly protein PilN